MSKPDSDPRQRRGRRWDEPFSRDMTDALVDRVLRVAPFSEMDPAAFPRSLPLRDILKNDARIVSFEQHEIVMREGDYGNSAFQLLDGELTVALARIDPALVGRAEAAREEGWGGFVARLLGLESGPSVAARSAGKGVFLQDVPRVLTSTPTAPIAPGEVFGELSALTRSPRSATVFAAQRSTVLELRWQGLRDLMKHSRALREHIESLYRKNSLHVHLRETPLLQDLSPDDLSRVAEQITFESYGDFDWRERHQQQTPDPYELALREPTVVEEGQSVDGMLLVRNGFARVWRRHGEGRITVAYLGKGSVIGAKELALCALSGEEVRWRRSVSAVGRLDLLVLPSATFNETVLPKIPRHTVVDWVADDAREDAQSAPGADASRRHDFLVDGRFLNGREAMVIDLERCTRCDDCLRACASTHQGVARFTREGPLHDAVQFTHACMHCADPVCMIGCPTGAIHREPQSGVVRIEEGACIGCSVCAQSCPYDNIRMIELRDEHGAILFDDETQRPLQLASKCDLCHGRAAGPACQSACPHDALVRIDLTRPEPFAEWTNR